MFDEDVEYAASIRYVFDGTTLPSIHDDLRAGGGTVAQGLCPNCRGTLYDHDHEVICANCSTVIGADTSIEQQTPWEYFRANRPTYHTSDKNRCLGGFPHVYDWVEREDIDRPIKRIDPETFYR